MPSVVILTTTSENLADPKFQVGFPPLNDSRTTGKPERVLHLASSVFRVHVDGTGANPLAVLLPFDRLFEIRATAALRLYRALRRRNPGPNSAALTEQRRNHLIQALRALDARLEGVSYREIAEELFHVESMSAAAWKTHPLRDKAIRRARRGRELMNGGYRKLLLHPYRRRK